METPGVSNPIERRFMQAHDDWLTFAGNKKRNYYYGKRMKPMNLCLKPISGAGRECLCGYSI